MKKMWLIKSYLQWRLHAKSRFKVHSPFVYALIEQGLRLKKIPADCKRADAYRVKLSQSKTVIETVDFGTGAGGKDYKTLMIPIGKIIKRRSPKKAQLHLLYFLARYFKPETLLEFGSAAGISAVYLKKCLPESRMITMEGCASLANVAERTLREMHVKNISIEVGNFNVILPEVLKSFDKIDLVFFDGNHRKEPTIDYFNRCYPLANENSVFIFDDIHWSPGMAAAWNEIKKDLRVSLTIDLFYFGLVFFKKGMEKQNLTIRV